MCGKAWCKLLKSTFTSTWIMNMAWKQSFYRLKLWIIKPSAARIAKTNHSSYYSFIDIWHFNVAVRESVCVRLTANIFKRGKVLLLCHACQNIFQNLSLNNIS